jgi:hypothetical protein
VLFKRWTPRDTLYFALIGIGEILIFFRNPGHFFIADTVQWMGYRHRSPGDFFGAFISADPALWYRPLSQRTVESLLYPLAGLQPISYHVAMFVLFFTCTIAVFLLTEQLTESKRAAWIATLIFAPHVTHAFTTYDTAFVPEMMFTLFFVGSAIAWVSWLRTGNRIARLVSAVLFVGSLLSKETAVALPFTLFAIWLFLPVEKRRRLWSLAPHFVILLVYLVFAIGYVHIRAIDIRQLVENPGTAGQRGYQLVLGKNVWDSAGVAFSWAFGLARRIGQWPVAAPWMLSVLKAVRALIMVLALFVMFTPRRKYVLIGLAWFLLTAAPTLPLLDRFVPYYLFAPLVGFSIAVGVVLDWAYERSATYSRPLAFAFCAALLGSLAYIHATAASSAMRTHPLLGISAENAESGMKDMLALHPSLPKGATLVIFDEENPYLYLDQGRGMLYSMAYKDDSVTTMYFSTDISVSKDDLNAGKTFVFKSSGGHITDITSFVKQRPELLLPHDPTERYRLELSKSEVSAVNDAYVMHVSELKDSQDRTFNVLRAYNGVVEDPFQVTLDHDGQFEFKLDNETKSGTYTFVALQRLGEPNWVTVSGSVRVR